MAATNSRAVLRTMFSLPVAELVLDEVETIQRVRSDSREKSLNALRQLIDDIYAEQRAAREAAERKPD